eukprot:1157340-Pelagomonas_calceolata.AAC.15
MYHIPDTLWPSEVRHEVCQALHPESLETAKLHNHFRLVLRTTKTSPASKQCAGVQVDEPPWHGWPDVPEGQSLENLQELEDPSFRLLRFVKHHARLQEPLVLPKTGMRVQDGLVFGFAHPKLKAEGQEELPIHTGPHLQVMLSASASSAAFASGATVSSDIGHSNGFPGWSGWDVVHYLEAVLRYLPDAA